MEVENTSAEATTTTEPPAATDAPVATGEASTQEAAPDAPEKAETPNPAPPAYTPNLKFKVVDKEHEIDPLFAQVIKDADTEKKVRELHEKAYGIEWVKQDRERAKEERNQYKQAYEEHEKNIGYLSGLLTKKDFDTFAEQVKISEDDWLRHALKIVERRQNPQLQQQYQQQRQYEAQLQQQQAQAQHWEQNYSQVAVQAKEFELTNVLSRPEVTSAAQAFDQRFGEGAFKAEVVKRGQYHWYTSKRDVPAEQAVNEVLALIGAAQPQQQQQAVAPVQGQTQQPQVMSPQAVAQAQAQKPVIPNIQGRGTSPAKKVPQSLDDLRKMAKEMEAAS